MSALLWLTPLRQRSSRFLLPNSGYPTQRAEGDIAKDIAATAIQPIAAALIPRPIARNTQVS